MDEFGDLSGIVFNVRSQHLVCGHQRRDNLPADSAIVDYREASDDRGTVGYGFVLVGKRRWPVLFVDWDDVKEKAANVSANNPHIAGDFSAELQQILQEINAGAPDIFSSTLLDELLEEQADHELKPVPMSAPKLAWVLIAIPLARYGDIALDIEKIAAVPDIFIETTITGDANKTQR